MFIEDDSEILYRTVNYLYIPCVVNTMIDRHNMLQVLKNFSSQCKEALGLPKGISVPKDISNIAVLGMGGSAIGGDLLKSYLINSKVPVTVVRDYKAPGFIDENRNWNF